MRIVSTVFCYYYNQILSWFFNMVHLHFLQTLLSSFWSPFNGSAVCFRFHRSILFSSAALFFSSIIPGLYPGQEKSAICRSSTDFLGYHKSEAGWKGCSYKSPEIWMHASFHTKYDYVKFLVTQKEVQRETQCLW